MEAKNSSPVRRSLIPGTSGPHSDASIGSTAAVPEVDATTVAVATGTD